VTVLRSDVIAAEEAKGLDPSVVALQHIDGPPAGIESQPAFMYIFLYRGPEKRGIAGNVIPAYPCAAYIDMEALEGGWLRRGLRRDLLRCALKHEVGHIMGLCAGGDDGDGQYHGDGNHCYDPDCLMKPASTASFTRALFGLPQRLQGRLCAKCLSELEEKRAHAADPGLSFHGPALVRRNDGYYVAFVPKVFTLGFDEADAAGRRDHVEDARRLVEDVRSQMPEEAPRVLREPGRCLSQMKGDPRSPSLFAARKDAVERAAEDTNSSIRRMAESILERGETQPPEPFSGADAGEWIILPDQQAEDAGAGE